MLQPNNSNSYPVWKNTFGFYLFRFPYSNSGDKSSARWAVGPNLGNNTDMVLYSWPGANSPLDKNLTWMLYHGGWQEGEYFSLSVYDKGTLST